LNISHVNPNHALELGLVLVDIPPQRVMYITKYLQESVYKLQKTSLKNLKTKITIAHSPDADDAFMFYALAKNIIFNEKYEIEHILKDIQSLNKEALSQIYDVQAISFFAYPDVEEKYQLMSCGGSVGNGYGPILVANNEGKTLVSKVGLNNLRDISIAIPGEKTTAFLLLKLLIKDFSPVYVKFDEIIEAVVKGTYPLGLIIHEGQLSYLNHGLSKVVDLGEWWLGKTNLPLPLGGNVIKRNLAEDAKKEINNLVKQSISYGLENKEKVVSAVKSYAREIEQDNKLVNKFVSMYVNDFTLDYGISGKIAIKKLYELAYGAGLIKKIPILDFIE